MALLPGARWLGEFWWNARTLEEGLLGHGEPPASLAEAPDGFYSATDIAKAMHVPGKAEAIRKALERLFKEDRLPGGAWMENSDPAQRQAKILYRLSAVRPLLARFERSRK